MALRTRIAAGAATLALSLTGLAAATAPANAAPAPGAHPRAASPAGFHMDYFYGSGATIPLAQQYAYLQAQMWGYSANECSPVRTTGGPGGYYVTILCTAWT